MRKKAFNFSLFKLESNRSKGTTKWQLYKSPFQHKWSQLTFSIFFLVVPKKTDRSKKLFQRPISHCDERLPKKNGFLRSHHAIIIVVACIFIVLQRNRPKIVRFTKKKTKSPQKQQCMRLKANVNIIWIEMLFLCAVWVLLLFLFLFTFFYFPLLSLLAHNIYFMQAKHWSCWRIDSKMVTHVCFFRFALFLSISRMRAFDSTIFQTFIWISFRHFIIRISVEFSSQSNGLHNIIHT